MVHIIKVYFQDQNNEQQIRRLAVSSEIVGNFNLLAWKIREIFPAVKNENFDVTWKDSENDVIHMSSDEELAQALANAEEGLLRIYVKVSHGQNPKEQEVPKTKPTFNECHKSVVCDGCDKDIYGCRYKCLQCVNYDLCSTCNTANKHPDHDMIKLVRPVQIHRKWVFLGARKMWRSMFCPWNLINHFPKNSENQQDSSSSKSEKPQDSSSSKSEKPQDYGMNQWKTVVDDLLKGDFVPAEKLVKENLGHFMNFVESFANVDVRIETPPFGNVNNQSTRQDCTKNEEKTSPETKPAESSTMPESAVNVDEAADEKTNVSNTKSDPIVLTDTNEKANENVASTSGCSAACSTFEPIKKDSSPTGLFSDFETSVNVDGWTLVHDDEVEKQESPVPMTSQNIAGPTPLEKSLYPGMTVGTWVTTPEQANVEKKESPVPIPSQNIAGSIPQVSSLYPGLTPEQANADEAQSATIPKETAGVSQDPEIINALIKMQAMGFTNEGGWLERLLITKNGNINAALDALYPNARRN